MKFYDSARLKHLLTLLLLGMIVIPLSVWGLGNIATGFRAQGSPVNIEAHGICKKVANATGKDLFVPTKTSGEWSTFRGNIPPNVTITDCNMPTACYSEVVSISGSYTFAYNGPVEIYMVGGGGGGGACSVDNYRESTGSGGGGGGFALLTLDDPKSLGVANFTIGTRGLNRGGSGGGYREDGGNGGDTIFTLGSYSVTAKGGQGGRGCTDCNIERDWGKACGAVGGGVTFNAAASSILVKALTGGESSLASIGGNGHAATGGASPNLDLGTSYDGQGVNIEAGAEAVTGTPTVGFFDLISGGGGEAVVHGAQNPGQAIAENGAFGSGGGGSANQDDLAQSGSGGAGLAAVYYYDCSPLTHVTFNLYGNNHTNIDCNNVAGEVVLAGGEKICRLNEDSCPTGWTQRDSWSKTVVSSCTGLPSTECNTSCTTSEHVWSNNAIETCSYRDGNLRDEGSCITSDTSTCNATQTQIGCY